MRSRLKPGRADSESADIEPSQVVFVHIILWHYAVLRIHKTLKCAPHAQDLRGFYVAGPSLAVTTTAGVESIVRTPVTRRPPLEPHVGISALSGIYIFYSGRVDRELEPKTVWIHHVK